MKITLLVAAITILILGVLLFKRPSFRIPVDEYKKFPYSLQSEFSFESDNGDTVHFFMTDNKQSFVYYKPKGSWLAGKAESRKLLFHSSKNIDSSDILIYLTFSSSKKLAFELNISNLFNRYFYQKIELDSLNNIKDTILQIGKATYRNIKVIHNNFGLSLDNVSEQRKYFDRIYWSSEFGIVMLTAVDSLKFHLLQ